MKLYLISRIGTTRWDEYDSAVVAAESEEDAKNIHPDRCSAVGESEFDTWVPTDKIDVKYLGETEEKRGVICASFNAG